MLRQNNASLRKENAELKNKLNSGITPMPMNSSNYPTTGMPDTSAGLQALMQDPEDFLISDTQSCQKR
jgi:hypothetical protein